MSKKRFCIALAVIVIIAACAPLLTVNCIGGHDIIYHLLRIEALKEGIRAGRPFLRVNMLFLGGTGYASSMFYPDLLLYFPALLRAAGVHINQAYHLFIAACIVLGFLSSFYCVRYIAEDDYSGLAGAVIFTLYQYHIFDIYERSAVGEFTAVIFLPLVIAGIYDLICRDFKKPGLLFLGMAGVILCHTITAVICLGFCVIAGIFGIKNLISDKDKLIKLILTALAVLGATAFYWVPVLEVMLQGVLKNDFVYNMQLESAGFWEVFFNRYNRMGAVIFVLLLIAFLVKDRMRYADMCIFTGLFLAFCSTSLIPWGRLQSILGFIQFPWRLFNVSGPMLAIAEGIYLGRFVKETAGDTEEKQEKAGRLMLVLLTGVMLVSAFANMQAVDQEYYSYSDDYFEYKPFTTDVLGGEWLPAAVSDREKLSSMADTAYGDDGNEYDVNRYKNELEVKGISKKTSFVDVPFVYYKGYVGKDTESGASLYVTGEGRNGLARVYTNGAQNIRVKYSGTAAQHISSAVSLITVLLLALYVFFGSKRAGNRGAGQEH